MSHKSRMKEANAARKANGLEDTFARMTELRSDIDALRRFLAQLNADDIPSSLKDELKERVQGMIAASAEELYILQGQPATND